VSNIAHRGFVHLGKDVSKDSIAVAVLSPDRDTTEVDKIFHDADSVRRPGQTTGGAEGDLGLLRSGPDRAVRTSSPFMECWRRRTNPRKRRPHLPMPHIRDEHRPWCDVHTPNRSHPQRLKFSGAVPCGRPDRERTLRVDHPRLNRHAEPGLRVGRLGGVLPDPFIASRSVSRSGVLRTNVRQNC
jgi:hypothetical protein